jgi:hypothetical protein
MESQTTDKLQLVPSLWAEWLSLWGIAFISYKAHLRIHQANLIPMNRFVPNEESHLVN